MRPLTEEEAKMVFEKLYKYVGKNLKALVERSDEAHCFRLHKNRVYYMRESLFRKAAPIARDNLVALGTGIGKITHGGKFHLTVGALELLAQHAKHKIWLKPSSELQFLYGNNVLKAGLGRITDNTAAYSGVVIFNMADVPLGFGVMARSTIECKTLDPTAVVAFHQADVGEYLRSEETMS
ncbi:unnamed protein product [Ostreobium quekettii]|uniref:60S ribosome subunit biogenesis protein NIP7 homolog n=1 Tax=Ostreobium quekettii TaxID=121088 RepID=A0A8S1IT50_9CHLO|nr:unnamed protein product [Ostreobium quekettii]